MHNIPRHCNELRAQTTQQKILVNIKILISTPKTAISTLAAENHINNINPINEINWVTDETRKNLKLGEMKMEKYATEQAFKCY